MTAPAIELKDVTAGYRFDPVFAHLNLQIAPGSFTGIVGPTGAGKTTLLRTILGLIPLAGGTVTVDGNPIDQVPAGSIGYVPQRGATDPTFPATVEQVILMGFAGSHPSPPWTKAAEHERAHALARELGVDGVMHHHIHDISGGQQQRAFLARALINKPRVLVLDEPTAGVDIRTQHDILQQLATLNRGGVTVVMATHDLNAIAVHLPNVICFNGEIVAQGNPRDIFDSEVLTRTFGEDLDVIDHEGRMLITGRTPVDFGPVPEAAS